MRNSKGLVVMAVASCIFIMSCPTTIVVRESAEEKALASKLHGYAMMKQIDKIKELAEEGADFSVRGTGELSALHIAAEKGYMDIVQVLVENGADLSAKTKKQGKCPFQWALEFAQPEIAMYLLENGAPPNSVDDIQFSNLYWAIVMANPDVTQALLEKGADPNLANYLDETPLFQAALDREIGVELMTILLDEGADIFHRNMNGQTALEYLTENYLTQDAYKNESGMQENAEFLRNRMK